MLDIKEQLILELRKLMHQEGVTQAALARTLSISRSRMSKILQGECSIKQLEDIIGSYDCKAIVIIQEK